jgi:hypothetical protein
VAPLPVLASGARLALADFRVVRRRAPLSQLLRSPVEAQNSVAAEVFDALESVQASVSLVQGLGSTSSGGSNDEGWLRAEPTIKVFGVSEMNWALGRWAARLGRPGAPMDAVLDGATPPASADVAAGALPPAAAATVAPAAMVATAAQVAGSCGKCTREQNQPRGGGGGGLMRASEGRASQVEPLRRVSPFLLYLLF